MQCLSSSMRRLSLRAASDILTGSSATVRCFFWFARRRHRRLAWQRLTSIRIYLQPIISVCQDMGPTLQYYQVTLYVHRRRCVFFSECKPPVLQCTPQGIFKKVLGLLVGQWCGDGKLDESNIISATTRAGLSQGEPRDAAVKFDMYRILQRHFGNACHSHEFTCNR